jgi:hypothetical protein
MTTKKDDGEQWHLDKKVPVGLIIALLTQGAAGLWFIADIKKDVELLKAQAIVQHDRDERQDKSANDTYAVIRTQLEKMDAKLDRLIEKQVR